MNFTYESISLSITWQGMLKFPNMVNLPLSPCGFINFCFLYFVVTLLGVTQFQNYLPGKLKTSSLCSALFNSVVVFTLKSLYMCRLY